MAPDPRPPVQRLGDAASMSLAASLILTAAAAVRVGPRAAPDPPPASGPACGRCPEGAARRALAAALTQAGTALSDHAVETRVLVARSLADACATPTLASAKRRNVADDAAHILARRDQLASALGVLLDGAGAQIREARARL